MSPIRQTRCGGRIFTLWTSSKGRVAWEEFRLKELLRLCSAIALHQPSSIYRRHKRFFAFLRKTQGRFRLGTSLNPGP